MSEEFSDDNLNGGFDASDCIAIIDFDTPVFKAAKGLQEDYIEIEYKDKTKEPEEGWKKEFKNVTTLYGRKKSRDGGWIAQENAERDEDNQIAYTDFNISESARIVDPDNFGFSDIKNKVESIMAYSGCKDFKLLIGGSENYRYDVAKIKPYKGQRKDKPLKLQEMRNWTIDTYGDRVEVADGEEADDVVAQYAHLDYLHYKEHGKHLYVIFYIDKDIDMCIAPHANYDKLDLGIRIREPYDAATCFCSQMLTGDKTDNIEGLPNLSDETRTKYGIRKGKGIGPVAVENLFTKAVSIPKLFKVVAECYESYFGNEPFEMNDWRYVEEFKDHPDYIGGESSPITRTWVDMLDENLQLLYMRRERGVRYDTRAIFTRFGCELPVQLEGGV